MRRVIKTLTLLAVVMLFVGPVIGANGYSISATPKIDVPSQTAEVSGTEYTIDSITRTTTDDGLSVSTDVPSNNSYFIQLRNPDNQIVSRSLKSGDADHDISNFGSGEAGSYSVIIERNGVQAVHPVVIPGYTLSVTAPSKAEQGSVISVTASVTERDVDKHSELDYVEVVAGDSDTMVRQTLSKGSSGKYTTNLSTSDFKTETYDLSVVIRGDAKVRGRNEIVGIADPQQLNITEPAEATPTTTSTPGDNPNGGTGSTGGGMTGDTVDDQTETEKNTTATPSTENNSAQTATVTQTVETQRQQTTTQAVSTDSSQQSPVVDTNQTKTSPADSTSPTATSNEVLEPATTSPATTDEAGPSFTIGLTIFAGILALYLGVRSSQT